MTESANAQIERCAFAVARFLNSRISEEAIGPDSELLESGLIDSAGVFEVVVFAEDEYGVMLSPESILPINFATPKAIARLILGS